MSKSTKLVSLDQHIAAQAPVVADTPLSHKQQQALQAPVVATPKPIPFRIIEDVRPTAGGRLFAFTQAWLEVAGLTEGKAIDRTMARKVAGDTAIAYHAKLGNFETTKDGLALTVKGRNFFAARIMDKKVDPKQVEAVKAILTHGKMDGDFVKHQGFIVAM